jgi:hypothetical protein
LQRSFAGNWGPVKIVKPSGAAQNDESAAALWELSEQLVSSSS